MVRVILEAPATSAVGVLADEVACGMVPFRKVACSSS